jgi:hypothetical protein
MTNAQFVLSEITWAKKLLAEPSFQMPNKQQSHVVAQEVLDRALDEAVGLVRVDAFGGMYLAGQRINLA